MHRQLVATTRRRRPRQELEAAAELSRQRACNRFVVSLVNRSTCLSTHWLLGDAESGRL